MYCTQCGFKLDDGDLFCSQCGKPTRPDAPPRAEPSKKQLMRPMSKKKIAGVCAGFADYLGVDVTLVRLIWLLAALIFGTGFLAYIVAWIVMPRDDSPRPAQAY